MTNNVGGIDRVLRILIGAALVVAAIAGWLPFWGWIGLAPLATGLVGWCPAYVPFGFKTNKSDA